MTERQDLNRAEPSVAAWIAHPPKARGVDGTFGRQGGHVPPIREDAAQPDRIAVADGGDPPGLARVGLAAGTSLRAGASGCCGVGVPFAAAAAPALPDRRVIPVNGGGASAINAMDVDTAGRNGTEAVPVVSSDATPAVTDVATPRRDVRSHGQQGPGFVPDRPALTVRGHAGRERRAPA